MNGVIKKKIKKKNYYIFFVLKKKLKLKFQIKIHSLEE